MAKRKGRNDWVFGAVAGGAVALVAILLAVAPSGALVFVRAAGLLGYTAIFLAILSSAYLKPLIRFFGRSFIKIHHIVSIAGLILISLHPMGWAISQRSVVAVLPRFDSWISFWTWAGPPAYDLLLIAAVTAFFSRRVKSWRVIHLLMYIVFAFGSIHALLLGSDTRHLVVRIVMGLMLLAVVAVFVKRHLLPKTTTQVKPKAS